MGCRKAVWDWLKQNSQAVSAFAATVQAVAVAFVVYQLWLTWTQISVARISTRASLEFQMQQDGRELLDSISPRVYSFIFYPLPGQTSPISEKDLTKDEQFELNKKVEEIINYYAAIWRLHANGVIGESNDEYWKAYQTEFCNFVTLQNVHQSWIWASHSSAYEDGFRQLGNQCQVNDIKGFSLPQQGL